MHDNATLTTINTINVPVKVAGTFAINGASNFNSDTTGKLTYTGATTETVSVSASVSIDVVGVNQKITIYIAKNGIVLPAAKINRVFDSGDIGNVGIFYNISMVASDYLEVFVSNSTSTNNLTVTDVLFGVSQMPKVVLPIANGFYESDSLPISAQECVNFYPNIAQAPALNQETLYGTAGLEEVANANSLTGNRGAHEMNGVPYFVMENRLFSMAADYTLTFHGEIAGTTRVSMADNGTQLFILVPNGNGYIYNHLTNTFAQITDPDFTANGNPQLVVFIDGYFCLTTDSKKFIVSALNNGLSYNALDFGTAESDPDEIVAPVVFKNQLFIGGSQTIEAFQNIGGADFPFQRTGLFLQKGIVSPFSIQTLQDTFVFIGAGQNESPAIWTLQGNDVAKISTTAIDKELSALTESQVASIYSWGYAEKGAYFVGFSLPSGAFVYDIITKRWHERKSVIDGTLGGYRVTALVRAYNNIWAGDLVDGRVGNLDPNVFDEYGTEIRRSIVTQPFQNNMESFVIPEIELTVESGVGNAAAVNPQIGMARSRNAKIWSDTRYRNIGKVGEYNHRAIWRRNGRAARFELFRFTMSDPVKPVIIQMTADIEGVQ